ncbi:hypothetical protein BH23ACI1_BH23ACI1_19340 [soil metagenome]
MKASDLFAGPILRRAEPGLVTIWFATRRRFDFEGLLRRVGDEEWMQARCHSRTIKVFPKLFVNLALIVPMEGKPFPSRTLIEYAICEIEGDGFVGTEEFEKIVRDEKLAYGKARFPRFAIHSAGRPLNVLYGSCRKPHGVKGVDNDALSFGDDLLATTVDDVDARPAMLCLGGDQLYADDVAPFTFDQLASVAAAMGAPEEGLPGGLGMPAKGRRMQFLFKEARFTSDAADNHLITFAEYVAMYGLALNRANWPSNVTDSSVRAFVDALPKVRRLLANTPTYMIFDDHDVTDDWNLSVRWRMEVHARYLGRRIVANALGAYWLFQAWGNDPMQWEKALIDTVEVIEKRATKSDRFDEYFWGIKSWEFSTPTVPFVYFIDTRTERGTTEGARHGSTGAPAYLRDSPAWKETATKVRQLVSKQGGAYPVIFVATAPVFGFELVDAAQAAVTAVKGPYFLDFEGWAGNTRHLCAFARMCGTSDVVLLSGDVHYGYSSTVHFHNFDDPLMRTAQALFPSLRLPATGTGDDPTYQHLWSTKFLQLTSSALRNFAGAPVKLAAILSGQTLGWFVDQHGRKCKGRYRNGTFAVSEWQTVPGGGLREVTVQKAPAELKPRSAFVSRYNDTHNAFYLGEHNLGLATFRGRAVTNAFLTGKGIVSGKSWDFNNSTPWE